MAFGVPGTDSALGQSPVLEMGVLVDGVSLTRMKRMQQDVLLHCQDTDRRWFSTRPPSGPTNPRNPTPLFAMSRLRRPKYFNPRRAPPRRNCGAKTFGGL